MKPGDSNELFGILPPYLPSITEGETLFSWAARYHRLTGNVLATLSSLQLFGDQQAGLRHDFPSHLDRFTEITGGLLGSPVALANERTLLGFFAPFLDRGRYDFALGRMRGETIEKLKSTLGLLNSGVGAAHPMKACSGCMAEDLRQFGITRWHVEHQWPSVWICEKHSKVLQVFRNTSELKFLHRYVLPEDLAEDGWHRVAPIRRGTRERLRKLLVFTRTLASHAANSFRSDVVRYAALAEAAKRQWIASDGSMRFQEVKEAFERYFQGLDVLPGFGPLTTVAKEHGGILGVMLRQYAGTRHPLKQILMISFFFDSPSAFEDAYQRAKTEIESGNVSKYGVPLNLDWRAELRRLVEGEKKSMSQAAKVLGVSVPQAIHWAKKDGIKYSERPRVLTSDLEKVLHDLVREGLTRDEIARRAGVKKSFLRAYLANDPALRDVWRTSYFENQCRKHRSAFIVLLNAQKGVSVSCLKRIPGNGYTWLSRNDRDWLMSNLPIVR